MRANPQDAQVIEDYHARVASVINSIPIDFDGWVGRQVPLPQSATKLLNPNGIVARQYFHEEKGVYATLMIVQCSDARDMGGHYPPVCYPGNGWMEYPEKPAWSYLIGDQELRVYGFHRQAGRKERELVIYNLFILPTGVLTTSMRDVRKLSANYEYRQYGAAQLQVMIDGEIDSAEHAWIVESLYAAARPAIEAVLDAQLEPKQGNGGEL